MWHVSSRSGVATLRTAIHLLLTFLTYLTTLPFHDVYRGTVSLLRPRYRRAEYCDERVRVSLCVSVCLSAREHISGIAGPNVTQLCTVPVDVARFSLCGCDTLCTSVTLADSLF